MAYSNVDRSKVLAATNYNQQNPFHITQNQFRGHAIGYASNVNQTYYHFGNGLVTHLHISGIIT
jgi:hypothetical protein